MSQLVTVLILLSVLIIEYKFAQSSNLESDKILDVCEGGDIWKAERELKHFTSASALHCSSAFAMIIRANCSKAVRLHKMAKGRNSTLIPPLASLHLQGNNCNGLGDVYYVTAVIIKQLVDSGVSREVQINGHKTLITLLQDSGLPNEAEVHLRAALALQPTEPSLKIKSVLMIPGVYESLEHLVQVRSNLEARLDLLLTDKSLTLTALDEFSLSPTFFLVYQGQNDAEYLSKLNTVYARAHPALVETLLPIPAAVSTARRTLTATGKRLRVGFVSAHFRRHSICKLFCGIITGLSKELFDVYVFSALQESREDDYSKALARKVSFVRVGLTVIRNRAEVTSRNIDVLVFLDVGMDPATTAWAAARLSPIQICVWGHPSTTGMASMDFFVSSQLFHASSHASSAFSEQLVQLSSLGFYFPRPNTTSHAENPAWLWQRPAEYWAQLSEMVATSQLAQLLQKRTAGARLLLCPQYLPKLHPVFDDFLLALIQRPDVLLVLLDSPKKRQWRRTIENRWRNRMDNDPTVESIFKDRVFWLAPMDPDQWLTLLALGDVMLDPFPFGGGVTSLESLAVCTPVVTLAARQTVPALAAGMLSAMAQAVADVDQRRRISNMSVASIEAYVAAVRELLDDDDALLRTREAISMSSSAIFEQQESVLDWSLLLQQLPMYSY